jgi:hypothetical protein
LVIQIHGNRIFIPDYQGFIIFLNASLLVPAHDVEEEPGVVVGPDVAAEPDVVVEARVVAEARVVVEADAFPAGVVPVAGFDNVQVIVMAALGYYVAGERLHDDKPLGYLTDYRSDDDKSLGYLPDYCSYSAGLYDVLFLNEPDSVVYWGYSR